MSKPLAGRLKAIADREGLGLEDWIKRTLEGYADAGPDEHVFPVPVTTADLMHIRDEIAESCDGIEDVDVGEEAPLYLASYISRAIAAADGQ